MSNLPATDLDAISAALDPESLPRVAAFLAVHLGADLDAGWTSAARAAHRYAAEADLDDLEELAREWETVRVAARHLPLARFNDLLERRFASPWRVATRDEVEAVARELEVALRE